MGKTEEADSMTLPAIDFSPNAMRQLAKELAEQSFRDFIPQAWQLVEPATELRMNWHIDAVADHMQATFTRQITKLIINVPPGSLKSTVVSVMFQPWVWIQEPSARFLTSSYGAELAVRDSVKSRRLIDSDWYQSNWGDRFQMTSDQNTKSSYENNKTGYRIAMGTGGKATGFRGDYMVCFPYDILIATEEGEMKIGDIVKEGRDIKIVSYDLEKETTEFESILAYEDNDGSDKAIIEIELESGKTIECTEEHPVYVMDKGWTKAGNISVGDAVLEIQ